MTIIDRTNFTFEPTSGDFTGTLKLGSRTVEMRVISKSGNFERAFENAEQVLILLRDRMDTVERVVRELFQRLGSPNEDTPKGRRKLDQLLGQVSDSDFSCVVYEDRASTYFKKPRMSGHRIELQFINGAKLASATVSG